MNQPNKNLHDQVVILQEQLTQLLDREIVLSRELLSNLYEEEKALLSQDNEVLQNVLNHRLPPLEKLMNIREERMGSMSDLAHLLSAPSSEIDGNRKESSFPLFMDYVGDETCEVFVLRDELIALIEKINMQQMSNSHLFAQIWAASQHVNQQSVPWGDFEIEFTPHTAPAKLPERRKSSSVSLMIPESEQEI